MVEAMIAGGFDEDKAAPAVYAFLAGEEPGVTPYRYDPSPVSLDRVIHAHDRDVHAVMRVERPQLILFDNLLSVEECEQVIQLSEAKLTPSTIVDPETGKTEIVENRTSEGTWFPLCENPLIERLDRRTSALMNWPLENGEGLQVLRYRTGGEYRPHFDYFQPEQPGSATHVAKGGQRTSTLIIYLNDVEAGGETVFPDAGISVAPRRGQAIYFRYCNSLGQVDPLTRHAGAPVLAGSKWILTKWMHRYRR